MILNCPLPPALTVIPAFNCPFKLDQIVRLAFQRRQPVAAPPFASLADIQTLANWQSFLDATSNAKIVLSPIFAGMVIPQSEALTTGGGDNSTFNGIPEYNGENMVTITGVFRNLPPIVKRAMDALSQESLAGSTGVSNLTIYPINRLGYIFPHNILAGGDPTATFKGIPIYNFRLSSVGSEGYNSPNTHGFSFSVPAEWADSLQAVKPTFDPLTDLNGGGGTSLTFDSQLVFGASNEDSAYNVGGGAAATDPVLRFEFNRINGTLTGAPIAMSVKHGGVEKLAITTQAEYVGHQFRLTDTDGSQYLGVIANGTVNV